MATKVTKISKKVKKGNEAFLQGRISQINKVFGKFETEVEKAVNKFMKRGEKSSQLLRRNFDEIIDKIAGSDLYSRASEKKEEVLREFRKLADEVVAKVKNFDFRVAQPLLKEVRENLDEFLTKLQNAELVEKAKDRVLNTRNHVLSVLSIPTQKDVNELTQKVVRLEKKIRTLADKAAA